MVYNSQGLPLKSYEVGSWPHLFNTCVLRSLREPGSGCSTANQKQESKASPQGLQLTEEETEEDKASK